MMLVSETTSDKLEMFEKSGKYISQEKLDGDRFRAVIRIVNEKKIITLINRHENNYTSQFPEIVAGIGIKKEALQQGVVIDGEIAFFDEERSVYDHGKVTARQHIVSQKKIMRYRLMYPAKFYVFDLIKYGEIDMKNNPMYPYGKRHDILKRIIIENGVTELVNNRTDIKKHFEEEVKANREGIVIKSLNNIYSKGRSKSILKCKNWKFSEVKFDDFTDNNAGITMTNNEGDRVLCAGKQSELARAMIIQRGYIECKIRHLQTRTENGRLREPTFKGLKNENIKRNL